MNGNQALRPQTGTSPGAVILIDYTNLFGIVSERSSKGDQPDAVILDLIRELNRHVTDHLQMQPLRSVAFANIPPGNNKGHRATGAWLSAGIEPRYSYSHSVDGATTIDLTAEALELSCLAGPTTSFVILSGNNWYVPLIQRLQRRGHFVLMATLESPSRSDHLPTDVLDAFLNARFLLNSTSPSGMALPGEDAVEEPSVQKPTQTKALETDSARHTLEVIERFFGQYEEIYLTPLLRKLSETLEDEDEEPKTLINALEEAGAVWLEKRRGFPHNYTVLLMNTEHPDVQEVKETVGFEASDDDEEEDESYDDDYYPGEDNEPDDDDDGVDDDDDDDEEDDYALEDDDEEEEERN